MDKARGVSDLRGPAGLGAFSSGALFGLIRTRQATTRAGLVTVTGLARSTVSQRVDALIAEGLVHEAGELASSGGRPPAVLAVNPAAGVVLVGDLGATHCRLAVMDLEAAPLAELADDLEIALGPERVVGWVLDRFDDLLADAGRSASEVRAVGLGVPGPVEFAAGRTVAPPIMPGWDDVEIPELVAARFPVPVFVDNDVNIMASGEYWSDWRDVHEDLLFVKIGTGIGAGIVVDGRIHHGAQGTAGDIGHITLADHNDVVCRCGNHGCVEAVAGGAALARQLTELGYPAANSRDVVRLVRAGNPVAVRLVREAGRVVGEVLAGIVNFFNPPLVVIGGDLAGSTEQLLAGVREVVYQRSTALATRDLDIRHSRLEDRAGIAGAAVMALERVLAPAVVDEIIERRVARHKRPAPAVAS